MGSSTPDTIRRPLGTIDLCSSRWVRFQTGSICGRLVSGQRAGGVSASRSLSFGSPGKSLGGHLSPKAGEVFRTAHIRGLLIVDSGPGGISHHKALGWGLGLFM